MTTNNMVQAKLERITSRLFYSKDSDDYNMLNFSSRVSNIIDLNVIAELMMKSIIRKFQCSRVSLLLSGPETYKMRFVEQTHNTQFVPPIELSSRGAIIKRLNLDGRALTLKQINGDPSLMAEYEVSLSSSGTELLCPVKHKQKLVGLLVLSGKYYGGFYSPRDIRLLMTLCNEAAAALWNADLYVRAKESSNRDELTGLYNHRCFYQRLDEEISRCSRYNQIFSLAFLDIDYFKHFNDTSGHLAGDAILIEIGNIIQSNKRDIDLGFRYGGDEFAIMFPLTKLDDAKIALERLRRRVEDKIGLQGTTLTISAGIAAWPFDGVMLEDITKVAQTALYYAKQTGKNRLCSANEVAFPDVLSDRYLGKVPLPENLLSTIYALAATVDAKDHYTYGHSKKVSRYAASLAEAIGYKNEAIERIHGAALLHDIGKIGIADNVLNKREPLTITDYSLIKTHPDLGVAIIQHVAQLSGYLPAIQFHHERFDGSGYPTGLSGKNIPLDARILAVADAFDAMTSKRPYRSVRTIEEALKELEHCAGTQFDPDLVKVFIGLQNKIARENKESLKEGGCLPDLKNLW